MIPTDIPRLTPKGRAVVDAILADFSRRVGCPVTADELSAALMALRVAHGEPPGDDPKAIAFVEDYLRTHHA